MLNELKTKDDAIDKLTLFISNYNEKCVISTYDAKTDSGRIEKAFIGFELIGKKECAYIQKFNWKNNISIIHRWQYFR